MNDRTVEAVMAMISIGLKINRFIISAPLAVKPSWAVPPLHSSTYREQERILRMQAKLWGMCSEFTLVTTKYLWQWTVQARKNESLFYYPEEGDMAHVLNELMRESARMAAMAYANSERNFPWWPPLFRRQGL